MPPLAVAPFLDVGSGEAAAAAVWKVPSMTDGSTKPLFQPQISAASPSRIPFSGIKEAKLSCSPGGEKTDRESGSFVGRRIPSALDVLLTERQRTA
jgi:hypothetical protein